MTGPATIKPTLVPPPEQAYELVKPDTGDTFRNKDRYDHRPEVFDGPAPVGLTPTSGIARCLTTLEDRYVLARACAAAGGDDLGGLPRIREIRNDVSRRTYPVPF